MNKIILYDSRETNFTSRGLGVLKETLSCVVEEKLNGSYELVLEYPVNGQMFDELVEENIIKASTPRGDQLFRIYRIGKDDSKFSVSIYAQHIFYDNLDNFIEDINIISAPASLALDHILSNAQFAHPFSGQSDVQTSANARMVRMNVAQAIMGSDDNTLLSRWGGEVERDNFSINVWQQYGSDRGVKIKYGKNLRGLEVTTDMSAVATRVMPEGYNGLFLPEKYVDSPLLSNYHSPKILKIEFSDIKAVEEGQEDPEALPLEEAYTKLREAVNKLYEEKHIDKPKITLKVDFIELSQTEEYKDYAVLERIYPFDLVTVQHAKLGVDLKIRMYAYKWDSIEGRYESIELGSEAESLVDALNKTIQTQDGIDDKITAEGENVLLRAKEAATEAINNGLGGFVVKTRDELLIMDTDNINTAQKVWRWNMGGLGYSNEGYSGQYGLALTNDGQIVADRITTGIMSCNRILGGTLKLGGKNNGNGVLNLLDGNGSIIATMDINGLKILKGLINIADNFIVGADGTATLKKAIITGGELKMISENAVSPKVEITSALDDKIFTKIYAHLISIGSKVPSGSSSEYFQAGLSGDAIFVGKDNGDGTTTILAGLMGRGVVTAQDGFECGNISGKNGSFTTADGKEVTVKGGIITKIT